MPKGRSKALASATARMRPMRVVRMVYKDFPRLESVAPKDETDALADSIIEEVFEYFDIAPVLFGEPLQARIVANDLVVAVIARAKEEGVTGLTEGVVMQRWAERLAGQRQSLEAFQRLIQSLVRTKAQ